MDNPTYTTNLDGTVTIRLDGKDTRFAKESDLLAVKGASDTVRGEYEEKLAKHNADLAEKNRVLDEAHQELLKERTAKEQLERDNVEVATLRTKVGELEQSVTDGGSAKKQLEDELLGVRRASFGGKYKVDSEKLKEMTLDQLREADKTLDFIGFKAIPTQPANYDGGPPPGGGAAVPLNPLEGAKQELAFAKQLQAKKRAGGVTDPDLNP